MANVYISIVAATLIALLSMTAVAETPSPGMSGIEGTIVVSPTRPGPIRKEEGPSVAPVRNAQFAIKAGDTTVKTFTTDGEGRFQVVLPPGHYVIVREGALPRIGRWRFETDVVAGEMTKVNWTADSGMR
jgi:RNase P/RNase MRP subunit p29